MEIQPRVDRGRVALRGGAEKERKEERKKRGREGGINPLPSVWTGTVGTGIFHPGEASKGRSKRSVMSGSTYLMDHDDTHCTERKESPVSTTNARHGMKWGN